MNPRFVFASLIMASAVWSEWSLAANEPSLASVSTSVLPPLPDLPMPGTHIKVSGAPKDPADVPKKEEPLKLSTPKEETKTEEKPSLGVFEADRASELVY